MTQTGDAPANVDRNAKIVKTGSIIFAVITLIILACLGFAIWVYRSTFSGPPSPSANDWAALGSFFGGIFSPLVAFCTIPILGITVYLQWRIIDTQQREFRELHTIQEAQLELARSDSKFQRMSTYKNTVLSTLSQQITSFEIQIGAINEQIKDLERQENINMGIPNRNNRCNEDLQRIRQNLNALKEQCDELSGLIIGHTELVSEITITQYDSIDELSAKIKTEKS